jgi:predicted ATPase
MHGFPAALTSFVGRAAELGEVADLLARYRLVTVAGPGGAGKTRLDGVWLAELAPVADPAQVAGVVAAALGVPDQPGVRWRRRWHGCWPGSSCCWCLITAST